MAGGLDQFLNVAIPLAAIGFFCFVIFRSFRSEFTALGHWIKNQFGGVDEDEAPQIKIDPMHGGSILYPA